jgi:hypothetical protein
VTSTEEYWINAYITAKMVYSIYLKSLNFVKRVKGKEFDRDCRQVSHFQVFISNSKFSDKKKNPKYQS